MPEEAFNCVPRRIDQPRTETNDAPPVPQGDGKPAVIPVRCCLAAGSGKLSWKLDGGPGVGKMIGLH
jgi:hypothetical protein